MGWVRGKLVGVLRSLRPGARSLRSTLALYFLPIVIVPTVFLSFYSIRLFEENSQELFARRAKSERDAIVAEFETIDSDVLAQTRALADTTSMRLAARGHRADPSSFSSVRARITVRLYTIEGRLLATRLGTGAKDRVALVPKDALRRLRARGQTVDRFFSKETRGILTIARSFVRDSNNLLGVLECEAHYGLKELADLKNRRQVDAVFLDRKFSAISATFALSEESVRNSLSLDAFRRAVANPSEPIRVELGDSRFTAFLFDFPAPFGKEKDWGYVAVFLSLNAADALAIKLKSTMVYLALLLVLLAALLIFVFSNQIVKPVERLVLAMKRIKAGGEEQIVPIESPYEIEYLVQAFNEMSRNVSGAKRALELKLDELGTANHEIQSTQSQLVQSAKMASLGQIVAGVAHELNNPIAFIFSNMHHMTEYVSRVREAVAAFREAAKSLPEVERAKLATLEGKLELDYVLNDMEELTRSCVDGATRTKDIVLGLRTFSRAEDTGFRPSDLEEGLRATVRLLASELRERVTVHEEWSGLPLVEANLSQLNQVFLNLVVNGAHAIVAQGRRGDIWLRTRRDGDFVIVEIEDSGHGIPKENLERIFDPFFTTKKVGQGTGLGLSIAYGIVQRHNGTITVDSIVARGTKFTVRLPIRQSGVQSEFG